MTRKQHGALAWRRFLPGPLLTRNCSQDPWGFPLLMVAVYFLVSRVYGWEERCKFSEKPQCSAVMIWHLYSRAKSKHIGKLALTVALQTP